MDLDGSALRAGPFATSPRGVGHDVTWNVASIPFDPRNVVVRLRAVSMPRTGAIQFIPSFFVNVGRIVPRRPELDTSPRTLRFPTLTVGDSARVSLRISNRGNEVLRVTGIDVPDSQVVVEGPLAFDVDAGAERSLDISLAPRRPLPAPGALQIHCNDLLHPLVDLPLETDVRALA